MFYLVFSMFVCVRIIKICFKFLTFCCLEIWQVNSRSVSTKLAFDRGFGMGRSYPKIDFDEHDADH